MGVSRRRRRLTTRRASAALAMSRALSLALSLALATAPTRAAAELPGAPAPRGEASWDVPPEDATADDAQVMAEDAEHESLARAQAQIVALLEQAQARLDAGEPRAAIERWERAYALVPVGPGFAHQRTIILLEIVAAYRELARAEQRARPLERAVSLLDARLGELAPTDTENRAPLESMRGALAQELARAQTKHARAEQRRARSLELDQRERDAPRGGLDKRLLVPGSVIAGAGAPIGLGLMGLGFGLGRAAEDDGVRVAMDDSIDQDEREQRLRSAFNLGVSANRLAVAGAVLSGAMLATGVALVLASASPRRRQLTLAPGPTRRGLGLTLGGRF